MDEALVDKVVFAASGILVEENLIFKHFGSHKKSWDDFLNQDYMCCCMGYTATCFNFPSSLLAQRSLHFHYILLLTVVESLEDS